MGGVEFRAEAIGVSAIRWLRPASARNQAPASERTQVRLVRHLLAFESSLYAAVTPVLPHYAHTLHASKPAVGVLAAAYPAGLIPGSLLGGWIASRIGVKRTAVAGLIAFGIAIAAFGFATAIVSLDLLRAIQGAACGLIWGGGLTWVIAVSPRERRGAVIGSVVAAATLGTLLGPLFGTLAVALGTRPVFGALAVVSLALAVRTHRQPEPVAAVDEPAAADATEPDPVPGDLRRALVSALRRGGLGLGTWLVLLEAITFGAAGVLLPLRLSAFGATGVEIGATFVLESALASVLAPLAGRICDRYGIWRPLMVQLGLSSIVFATVLIPRSPLPLALVVVIALGGPLAGMMVPAVSMMTASAERAGLALVVATTMMNLAFALGETIGAPVAAGLAQLTSDTLPILLVSGLMLASIVPVVTHRRARAGGPDQPSTGSSVTSRATSAA